jgi:hypothetical protein
VEGHARSVDRSGRSRQAVSGGSGLKSNFNTKDAKRAKKNKKRGKEYFYKAHFGW